MPAVLGFDLGRNLGYGLVGRGRPVSGIYEICKRWSPLGQNLLLLEDRLDELIRRHRPDVLATAIQFINLRQATPINLIPVYSCFGILNMLAAARGLHLEMIFESQAREKFLGKGMVPRKSEAAKQAVWNGCYNRGWPACGFDASDALCVASAALEGLVPGRSYETTPLFQAAPTMRQRRGKKAA